LVPNSPHHTQCVQIDVFPYIVMMIASCVGCVVGCVGAKKIFHVGILQWAPASQLQYLLSWNPNILLACAACFTVFLLSTSEIRETTISTSAQHLIFRHDDSVHNPQTQTLIPLESWRSQLSPCVIRLGGHTDFFVCQSWSFVLRLIFLTESSKRSKRRYELSKNARKMTFFVIPHNKIIKKWCARRNGQVYSNGLLIYFSSFNQTCSKRCIFVLSAGLATSRI
jgi:hypothetical protein